MNQNIETIKNETTLNIKRESSAKKNKKQPVKVRATSELKVKEKKNTTINEEITFCIENNIQITIALLSKRVGVSTHRIRKYCKANYIDLDKINKSNYKKMLDPKRVKELKKQEKLAAEAKKLAELEQKKQEKLLKSLEKKNLTSSKHKMPIQIETNEEKVSISCHNKKIKLF